jgi:hypothetical protein
VRGGKFVFHGLTLNAEVREHGTHMVEIDIDIDDDVEMRARLARWEVELGEWQRRVLADGQPPHDSPAQPAEIVQRLRLLTDDATTSYRYAGSEAGGTGSERHAAIRFSPRVPDAASTLTLTDGESSFSFQRSQGGWRAT